jgi:diguanylate cyclase (GGDEF)-like protein
VALLDIDRFKSINDDHSHDVGDAVLRVIAGLLVAHVRETDLPARWGGDEFAILFRNTEEATAKEIVRRIQETVQQHDWAALAPRLKVGISCGVVEARPGDSQQTLVKRSDAAMYAQKHARGLAAGVGAVLRPHPGLAGEAD